MIPHTRIRFRAAAILVGLVAALAPVALLAYDVGTPSLDGQRVIAQATATAAPKTGATATAAPKTGTPTAPKTGNAGTLAETQRVGVVAALVVLAAGLVVGGRVLASRRA